MVQTILVLMGLIFAAVVLVAAFRAPTFRVRRCVRIAAPPERVYPYLADFRRWPEWSPWEGLDPQLKRTYGGPPSGQGATYAWEGNQKAGAGHMEITDADPPRSVGIQLDFTRPFPAHNRSEFTLRPDDRSTEVAWEMSGPSPLPMRVMGMVYSMERMIGPDFEKGLARLKAAAEAR